MAVFALEGGRLVAAQSFELHGTELAAQSLAAIRESVIELLETPLLPIAWQNESSPAGSRDSLLALDATGQVVTIEVVEHLDSDELLAALARAGRHADISSSGLAAMYLHGAHEFSGDLRRFLDSCEPHPAPGPRLYLVTLSLEPAVRPVIDALSGAGLRVQLATVLGGGAQVLVSFEEVRPLGSAFAALAGTRMRSVISPAENIVPDGGFEAAAEETPGEGAVEGAYRADAGEYVEDAGARVDYAEAGVRVDYADAGVRVDGPVGYTEVPGEHAWEPAEEVTGEARAEAVPSEYVEVPAQEEQPRRRRSRLRSRRAHAAPEAVAVGLAAVTEPVPGGAGLVVGGTEPVVAGPVTQEPVAHEPGAAVPAEPEYWSVAQAEGVQSVPGVQVAPTAGAQSASGAQPVRETGAQEVPVQQAVPTQQPASGIQPEHGTQSVPADVPYSQPAYPAQHSVPEYWSVPQPSAEQHHHVQPRDVEPESRNTGRLSSILPEVPRYEPQEVPAPQQDVPAFEPRQDAVQEAPFSWYPRLPDAEAREADRQRREQLLWEESAPSEADNPWRRRTATISEAKAAQASSDAVQQAADNDYHSAAGRLLAIARKYDTPFRVTWRQRRRGVYAQAEVTSWGTIVLSNGAIFTDPTLAAQAASGIQNVDGWSVWALDDGRTLGEL